VISDLFRISTCLPVGRYSDLEFNNFMDTTLTLIITRIITTAAKRKASDIHFSIGSKPIVRIDDQLVEIDEEEIVTDDFLRKFIDDSIDDYHKKVLEEEKEVSFVYIFEDKVRIRMNVYYQKGALAVSLKLISLRVPSMNDIGLPKIATQFIEAQHGLVIISGPYGSGKTTSAAAMVDAVNKTRSENIITIEKPIEYIFFNDKSIVEQREVGRDARSFVDAMKYCFKEDADVLMVGENDENIVSLMLDMAASGRLVFSVMGQLSAVEVLEDIISKFSGDSQKHGREILAKVLLGVIVQRLLPRVGGGKVLAYEVLMNSLPAASLILDGKIQQLDSIIQNSQDEGMMSLDQSLVRLVKNGEVSSKVAYDEAHDKQNFKTMIK